MKSRLNSESDVGCCLFDFRNLAEINRQISNLQNFPVSIDFSHRAGDLVVLLRIIAVVHYGCHIARFQVCKLSVDFRKIDMRTYTQRVFSMYGGEQKRVSMRFINPLLDTVIERFGTGAEVFYRPDDDTHFIVSADVEISDQFYGWICGFRKKAVIVSPPDVVADFQKFLGDIRGRYESE